MSFIKTHESYPIRAPPVGFHLTLIMFLEVSCLNTILEFRTSVYEFVGNTSMQSITVDHVLHIFQIRKLRVTQVE